MKLILFDQWLGGICLGVLILFATVASCVWLIHKIINHTRSIQSIFRLYWRFYTTIRDLPPGNYSKYRVTWDRKMEQFTDAEGIR